MVKLNKFHIFVALTCTYAAVLFYLSSLSSPPGPPELGFLYVLVHFLEDLGLKFLIYPLYFVYRYPDKFAHVILYLGLGLLLNPTLNSSKNEVLSKYAAPLSLLIGTLYGVTDEFHQYFVPYRSASSMDLFADFMGLLFAQLLILFYFGTKRWLKSKDKSGMSLDLELVLLFAFLAYLFVLVPPFNQTPLRIGFALPLLLFLPGYVLIAAMFPRREELSGIERFTLSIGLSIAIFVFDGFAISVTAWRFRPQPIILSLSLITLILTLITFLVRLRIPKEERFYFDFSVFSKFLESLRSDEKPSDIERALVIALVGSIIIASVMLIYAKVTFEEEKFSALYILGEGGKAENYPKVLHLLEPTPIIVGVENYEHTYTNYTLRVKLGGYLLIERNISLNHGEKWKERVYITPKHVGKRMKLEFLLYKEGLLKPYRSVHLWVDSVIDYENLAEIRKYALSLSELPKIKNSDFESDKNWTFAGSGHFRGLFTKFHLFEENVTICGYVIDNETGMPIENAKVHVNNHYGYERRSSTNETGYYEMKIIPDHFWMECSAGGYNEKNKEFDAKAGEIFLNITMEPIKVFNVRLKDLAVLNETIENVTHNATLASNVVVLVRGKVIENGTGKVIQNATVRIINKYGFKRVAKTDENGKFELKVIAGNSEVEVEAEGYMRNSTNLDISGDVMEVRLILTPEPLTTPEKPMSVIAGYVVDEGTGEPVPDAYIYVSVKDFRNSTKSNESGYYELKTFAGHIRLESRKAGYFSNSTEFNISQGESRKINMTIEKIPPPSTVSGYVSCNGTRLSGVEIVVKDRGGEKKAITNSDGYFEVEVISGHIRLEVLPTAYGKSMEFEIGGGERVMTNIELDAFPNSTYKIIYPSETPIKKGYFGGIYQEFNAKEGIASLSFKVCDSFRSNSSRGYMFKQVVLNGNVIWEDDVSGDEGWQYVKVPITLDNGKNRLELRAYVRKDAESFPVSVWWDDVRIGHLSEITKEKATYFHILSADGTENYPSKIYIGKKTEFIAVIENNEHETVNYILQVRLNGYVLKSENITVEHGKRCERKISFTPNQIGNLLKLEFLLFKNVVSEEPYKSFCLWVPSDIDYGDLNALEKYAIRPIPLINGDFESEDGWTFFKNDMNFTGKTTNLTAISPMNSYEISLPSSYFIKRGSKAEIFQNFSVKSLPATVTIAFNVRDSEAENEGYLAKQAILNGNVIWEDDIAGDEGWQYVKVPVTIYTKENNLALCVYAKRNIENAESFPVSVWWDDVRIEPITAITKMPTKFRILDANGTDKNYQTRLHLGEHAHFVAEIENNEGKTMNYILQVKLDGKLIESYRIKVEDGTKIMKNISFIPDIVGSDMHLEFILFKESVMDKPYRYFHIQVSCDIDYENLEPLLKYGLYPLPTITGGDMRRISAWNIEFNGSFRGRLSTENTSPPYSYCVEQFRDSAKGNYGSISQEIHADASGVAVISFKVRDSFTSTEYAKNLKKQFLLNGEVIWEDDVAGRDEGYVGWILEEYNKTEDKWVVKEVPSVKSGWMLVEIPVYLHEGENDLILRVIAEEDVPSINAKVYWDDVCIKSINELVKKGENMRMRKYRI